MTIRLELHGNLVVVTDDQERVDLGTGGPAQLFLALAEHAPEDVRRDELEDDVGLAGKRFVEQLSRLKLLLRNHGFGEVIEADGPRMRLALEGPFVTVLDDVRGLLAAARTALDGGRVDDAWRDALAAVRQAKAPLLRGAKTTPVVDLWRGRAESLHDDARSLALQLGFHVTDKARRRVAAELGLDLFEDQPGDTWEPLLALLREHGRIGDALELCKKAESLPAAEAIDIGAVRRLRAEIEAHERRISSPQLPLPLLRESVHSVRLVGREDQLAWIDREWSRADSGDFGVIVLTGPRGVGKSRIAYEAARAYHEKGANVLVSHLFVQDLPCRPVVTALRHLFEYATPERLAGVPPEDLRLLRGLSSMRSDPPAEMSGLSAPALYQALTGLLQHVANERPLVLVLEDLHKADPKTAEFFAYVSDIQPRGLLIIGTLADEHPPSPYAEVAVPVPLLSEEDAAILFAEARPGEVADADLEAQYRATGGNPFLIVHGARTDRIGAWVRENFSGMGARAYEVLQVAAVYAPLFDPFAVAEAMPPEVPDPHHVLEIAERAGVIVTSPQDPARFEFAHSLIREAIRSSMPGPDRVAISARLVEVLERGGEDPAILARHARRAAQARGMHPRDAAVLNLQAGQHAAERTAYAEAVTHLTAAAALAGSADAKLAASIQFVLGNAAWHVGDVRQARTAFEEAAKLARGEGMTDLEVEAALAYGGPLGFQGVTTSSRQVELLTRAIEAADAAGPERSVIRLKAALAGARTFSPEHAETSRRDAAAALVEAERLGEPSLIAEVLASTCWTRWSPAEPQDRHELAARFCAAADEAGQDGLRLEARLFRLAGALEDGDFESAYRDLHECRDIGARIPQHEALVAIAAGMQALLDGRLDEAQTAIEDALDLGRRDQNPAIFELYGVQILMLRRLNGQVHTLRAAAEGLTGAFSDLPAWKAGLGVIYANLGRTEDAARCLDALARDDFRHVPRDLFFLVTVEHASEIAHHCRDAARARVLYDILEPFADRVVVAGGAAAVYGVVDRSLGLLAEVLGDLDRAEEHHRRAHERHNGLKIQPAIVWSGRDLARVLERRGRAGDAERASALAAESARLADSIGMVVEVPPEALRYAYPGQPASVSGQAVERIESPARAALRMLRQARTRLPRSRSRDRRSWVIRTLPGLLTRLYRPGAACGFKGRIQVMIGPLDGSEDPDGLLFDIGDEAARVSLAVANDAELTITIPLSQLLDLILGPTNAVEVWLGGGAVVNGDPTLAARLIEMFAGDRPPRL